MKRKVRILSRRGAAALLAMLFLILFTTLSLAMLNLAATNAQSASNLSDVARAQDAAESGLRWMQYRFAKMQRPKTTVGNISAAVAQTLWPALQTAIQADFSQATINGQTNWNRMQNVSERIWTINASDMTSANISVDESGSAFQIRIQQHPLFTGDSLDARFLRVTSTGIYRSGTRSVALDFKIDKKIKFAVVGKVPIQIGRNTVVEGPIGMATANRYPPLLMLSDFQHFHSALATKVSGFETWLKTHHNGYDGRISVNNSQEYTDALAAGYTDYNVDGYVDEYDLFVKQFDNDGDKAVSRAEFTNSTTGKLFEENLFTLLDTINGPLFSADPIRQGYNDGVISNADGYAKVRGTITLATTAAAWATNLSSQGKTINDMMQGPVTPATPSEAPIKFGATPADIFDLSPTNFDQCAESFRGKTGPAAGTSVNTSTLKQNIVLAAAMANGGTADEKAPFGSTSYQATYRRPVFRNMTLKNVQIPKGLNALFDNCTFEGVTFVDMTHDITNSATHSGGTIVTDSSSGMTWSKRMKSGTFSNSTVLTTTNSYGFSSGNNTRFNNCTFKGPIAGPAATAYTHFTNSWEFTGSTLFDNQADETATIVAPNTNIEMGSFTNPDAAPSTLKGVVVAGNIDIRGTSFVDGSIIVTGDGAGNTTLSYFGADDSATSPGAMPEGGYGRLDIRYNPTRALPDGILLPIDLVLDADTYREGLD
ncbi:MAG: hypothetical protein ACREJC_21945 [Tepidisphaeraceae bacterium]